MFHNTIMSSQKKSFSTLRKFLESHRVKGSGKRHTNTSMANPKGSFDIPDDKYNEFLELYQDAVLSGNKLSLIEKHTTVGPIIIDLDFRHDYEPGTEIEREFIDDDIVNILKLYNEEIMKIFNIDPAKQLISCVFMREKPYVKDTVKRDGVHIMYPYIISEPNAQLHLRDCVIKRITNEFEELNLKNSVSNVIDKCVIDSNGWFLFGSTKPHLGPYEWKHTYNMNLMEIDQTELDFEDIENLPEFFSIRRHKVSSMIKEEVKESIYKYSKKKTSKTLMKKNHLINNYNCENIQSLVNILSKERADNYQTWMEVGWALHNIDSANYQLLQYWIEFSKNSKKFKDGECETQWAKFKPKPDGLTIASIYYWAKQDNPHEYNKIKSKEIHYYIKQSYNCTNYEIAKVLHVMFEHQFVCVAIKGKKWFQFKNHRWNKTEDGTALRKKIPNELTGEFCRYINYINHQLTEADLSEEEQDDLTEKRDKYTNITIRLGDTKFKENIMKECAADLFHNPDFNDKLDENTHLIGFNNGVYDLEKHEFRDGKPDDFISMTTKKDYVPLDKSSKEYKGIMDMIHKILPDDDVREYLLLELGSVLEGINVEEKFRIWTGTGGNGKSKLIELFTTAFGDYCCKFPISLLTSKRAKSNAATPEVMESKGKRFAYMEEPNEGEKINCGLMKEYTGGDKIKGRGLYKSEMTEFKPQFKMFLLCNDLPEVPPHDQGTWRRMEVIHFGSRFVDNPIEPNEFKKDGKLSQKIKHWGEMFMAILIEYHKKYQAAGYKIEVPAKVKEATDMYKDESDKHKGFIDDTLEKTNKETDVIIWKELYQEYKFWAYANSAEGKSMPMLKFKKWLEKAIGAKYIKQGVGLTGHVIGETNDFDKVMEKELAF